MINPQPVPVYRIRWLEVACTAVSSMHNYYLVCGVSDLTTTLVIKFTAKIILNCTPDVKLTAPPHPHTLQQARVEAYAMDLVYVLFLSVEGSLMAIGTTQNKIIITS